MIPQFPRRWGKRIGIVEIEIGVVVNHFVDDEALRRVAHGYPCR